MSSPAVSRIDDPHAVHQLCELAASRLEGRVQTEQIWMSLSGIASLYGYYAEEISQDRYVLETHHGFASERFSEADLTSVIAKASGVRDRALCDRILQALANALADHMKNTQSHTVSLPGLGLMRSAEPASLRFQLHYEEPLARHFPLRRQS